jgi:hypothetical protein
MVVTKKELTPLRTVSRHRAQSDSQLPTDPPLFAGEGLTGVRIRTAFKRSSR